MCEGVHTRELVVVDLSEHTIYNARCSAGRCYLSWAHYIERQGVVRLVATAVCYGSAGRESQLLSHTLAEA